MKPLPTGFEPSTVSGELIARMVLEPQDVQTREQPATPRWVRSRGLGLLLLVIAVAWILLAGAQAFLGLPHGAGWGSVRSQLHWIPTILSDAPRNLGTFLLVSVVVLAMALPGAALLRLLRLEWQDWLEHGIFAVAAGLAGWVPLLLVVGTYVGLGRLDVALTTGLYIAIPSLWIVPAYAQRLAGTSPGLLVRTRSFARDNIKWLDVILIALIAVLLYLALLGALIPETQLTLAGTTWARQPTTWRSDTSTTSSWQLMTPRWGSTLIRRSHTPVSIRSPVAMVPRPSLSWTHPSSVSQLLAFARVHFASTRLGLGRPGVPVSSHCLMVRGNREQ